MLLLLLGLVFPSAAQDVTHRCAGVAGPGARLACYDAAFPLSREVADAEMRQAEAEFGLTRPQESPQGPDHGVKSVDVDAVEGRVLKVVFGRNGQRSFHLENGQVWTQADARSSGHVQNGQVVQVRKGVLGNYQLVTPAGVTLRVRRER